MGSEIKSLKTAFLCGLGGWAIARKHVFPHFCLCILHWVWWNGNISACGPPSGGVGESTAVCDIRDVSSTVCFHNLIVGGAAFGYYQFETPGDICIFVETVSMNTRFRAARKGQDLLYRIFFCYKRHFRIWCGPGN
eukprot:EG_transcript_10432